MYIFCFVSAPYFIKIIIFLKAYAELEENTPGQILGVTFKTDGKSESFSTTNENISEKFRQGSKESENYTETEKIKTLDNSSNLYYALGFIMFVAFVYSALFNQNKYLEQQKELALERQKLEGDRLHNGPFSDA